MAEQLGNPLSNHSKESDDGNNNELCVFGKNSPEPDICKNFRCNEATNYGAMNNLG